MNREEKQSLVDDVGDKFRRAQFVVLADYTGIDVETMNRLRRLLEGADSVEFRVMKNTLCTRAISGTAMEKLQPYLTGPTAVLMGFRDPVSPSKVLTDFLKEAPKLKVKAGFFGGQLISEDDVKALATMPSREVLLSQLLGTLQAPLSQFVGVLAAVPQQFVGILSAYKDKLEEAA